jgi:hypothetical protein
MSKRVVAIVDRGMTDKTAVLVWSHEIPILEEVHGEGAITLVPSDQLAEDGTAVVLKGTKQLIDPKSQNMRVVKKGAGEAVEITTVEEGKPKTITREIERLPLRELITSQLGMEEDFKGDPGEEYARLAGCYGMHPEVRMPVVEVVYGRLSLGRFAAALKGDFVPEREAEAA